MVKIKADALRNMMPPGKDIVLKYMPKDNYDGEAQEMKITVFPMKVEEKGQLQQLLDTNKVLDTDGPEAKTKKTELIGNAILDVIFKVMARSVEGLTLEDVKNLPEDWKKTILREIFLFEGVDIDKVPKNENEPYVV